MCCVGIPSDVMLLQLNLGRPIHPMVGDVVTVSRIGNTYHNVIVFLTVQYGENMLDPTHQLAFDPEYFKPLETKETDIGVFTALLKDDNVGHNV